MGLPELLDRLVASPILDRPAELLKQAGETVLRSRRTRDMLHGVWLGHPLHPALIAMPIGAYTSASVLDLLPGRGNGGRRSADVLVGLGVVASGPAAVAGLADFIRSRPDQQRTGVVHFAANGLGLACYLVSLRRRAQGRRVAGTLSALAGLTCVGAGGVLGGHLAYRQATGPNQAESVGYVAPRDWCDVGAVEDFPDGQPVRRMAGEVPIVVVRDGMTTYALADRCCHDSGPLHEGRVGTVSALGPPEGIDAPPEALTGAASIECPLHGSVFRLSDGAVAHGPATAPQPGFDTRTTDGHLEVRVRA